MAADRAKLSIKRYQEVMGGFLLGENPDPIPKPTKLWISKTLPSNYNQTVADEATLGIDSHFE